MKRKDAKRIAEHIVKKLAPAAAPDQLQIAGSIRRGSREVKDIEIVIGCKPTAAGLFSAAEVAEYRAVDQLVAELVKPPEEGRPETGWWLTFDPKLKRNGPHYKRLRFYGYRDTRLVSSIAVDLFIVIPPRQWGVQLALRTGPSEFSRHIVTRSGAGGPLPSGLRVRQGGLYRGETLIPTPTEESFFEAIGIGWIPPAERTIARADQAKFRTTTKPRRAAHAGTDTKTV